MEDAEKRLLTERSEEARSRGGRSILTSIVGTLAGFSMLLLVYFHLDREVERRKRSEEKLIRTNRLYAVLSRVSEAVFRMRDVEALLPEVCRIAVEDGSFRMSWVGVIDPATGAVRAAAHHGDEQGYLGEMRICTSGNARAGGPIAKALRDGMHFVSNDITADPRDLRWREEALRRGHRSAAAFPIRIEGRLHGVFAVYGAESGLFDHENIQLLGEVASNVSLALERIEQEAHRKRAEEALRTLNQDLERRVDERTAELASLNRELEGRNREVERANRLKSEFLARMSHELRTPMNAIVGFSDLLAEQAEGPLGEVYQGYVEHIRDGARHLLELINDVLDLSKIEAGRIELLLQRFLASESLSEVLSVIRPLAEIKKLEISNRVPGDLAVYADRTRFKQVLYNLLSNAVKFTPEGGRVWIEGTQNGGHVSLAVSDTGLGIPAAEHAAIFEEFHQVGTTTKGIKEGTGLGLAITRRLVELHGGRIQVESQPGRGSRFTIRLPLECAGQPASATARAAAGTASGAGASS
jgi:signal transduction histidine kinase